METNCPHATVFVVDDDQQSRNSVCALVRSMGVAAEGFGSAEEFLEELPGDRRGCLVTDYRMLGMNGLDLYQELVRRGVSLPFVVVTAYSCTPLAVRAMQAGAVTVLDKPYADNDLWDAICEALARDARLRESQQQVAQMRERVETLTASERAVLERLLQGMVNKQIAKQLSVSLRTVESRRHEIMVKLGVKSLPELFHLLAPLAPFRPQ
jgi:two-component system, LuxR family, response regulator FixJ